MICPHCGKEIKKSRTERNFCPYCGQKLSDTQKMNNAQKMNNIPKPSDAQKTESGKSPKNNPRIGGAILVGVIVILILLIKSCGSHKNADVKEPAQSTVTSTDTGESYATEENAGTDDTYADDTYTEENGTESEDAYTEEQEEDSYSSDEYNDENAEDEQPTGVTEGYSDKYIDTYYEKGIRAVPYPDVFTKDQQKELESTYEKYYELEKEKTLPVLVQDAIANYDEYAELKESFEGFKGTTEELYQELNEWDPNLKDVAADDAAFYMAKDPLSYYLVEKGVGAVLSDTETGAAIRSGIEDIAISAMEGIAIALNESSKLSVRADALEPVAVTDNYALVRTAGTVSQMLDEIDNAGGYKIMDTVFEDRESQISSMLMTNNEEGCDAFSTHDPVEDVYNTWLLEEAAAGMKDAVAETKEEMQTSRTAARKDILERLGITDEATVNALTNTSETDDQDETDIQNETGAQYLYRIIDSDGKTYSTFFCPYDPSDTFWMINQDGMCSLKVYEQVSSMQCELRKCIIMDKDGNILFENGTTEEGGAILYDDITPSGNILRTTEYSDFDHGDYVVLELVEPDGKATKLMESGYINLSAIGNESISWGSPSNSGEAKADYFEYECGYDETAPYPDESGYIDTRTGEVLTAEEYEQRLQNVETDDEDVDLDEEQREILNNARRLNDDYLYYEDAIYDNDGKKAASVDAGRGVKDIIYENGNYWIVTNSGWYYVLNDSFEQTLEPVKFEETESYLLTGYGLLIAKNKDYSLDTVTYDDFMESYMNSFMPDETEEETNDERFALYDATGEVVLEVPGSVSIYNNQSDDLDHFIFGDAWVGWVNLKTRESMILDLPDEEVKTLGEE